MQTVQNQPFTQDDFKKLEKMVKSQGFKNRMMALSKFIMPFNKKVKLDINMGGGSYTDGNNVTVGINELFWPMPWYMVVMGAKALVGHEYEHVVSSDFPAFMAFQEEVYQFFKKNYGLENGRKLGAQLLNCTEDGRIEKRLVNRLKGMLKYIQFLNGTAWEHKPVTGENPLMEYTLNVCYMATSGIWMQDFDAVYGGTRMEEELEKVKPLIIKAINQPTTEACGVVTMEIIKANADFIAELMDPANQPEQDEDGQQGQQDDPTDDFDRTQAPTTTRARRDDEVELEESSHFVDEEENKKPQPQPSEVENTEEEDGQEDGNGSNSSETETDEDGEDGQGAGEESDNEEGEEGEDGAGTGEEGDDAEDAEGTSAGDSSDEESESSNGDSEDGDSDSQSSQSDNQDDNSDNSSDQPMNGNGDVDNGEHAEAHKTVEEMIREAIEQAQSELQEENEKAIEQSARENEKIEREENRVNKERKQLELSKKEKGAILNVPNGPNQLTITYKDECEIAEDIPVELKNKTRTFRKEVEKIFLNKQGFNKRNRRQGRLDVNQIWRVPLGDTDLFSQKGRPQDTDYAVSVLVDNSGSMAERIRDKVTGQIVTKSYYAKDAVVTLEEGLKGIAPLQITQFDYQSYSGINHKIIRSFEDSSDNNRTQERMDPENLGGGNGDGYSIKIAHRQLMKRPERQKVLFVLSDGEPSAYYGYNQAYAHVNEAVKEAREDGVIVIALRFGTPDFLQQTADAYRTMYEHSYIACEPNEMRKELVKLLRNVIK